MKPGIFSAAMLGLAGSLACAAQTAHYLDCAAGSDAANSLTPQTAWRTVAKANSYTFRPGDSLLVQRGGRCEGMLWPKGSGTEQASIRLGAYGHGALPVIVGGLQPAGVQLHNQQYWEIENLEILGGSPYGIHVGGTEQVLRHFRITNVVVHDVPGEPATKDSGLVVIAPDKNANTRIDDVIVDGVTAYRTSEWAGIIVNGAGFDSADGRMRGEHIEVRNSIVHDVAGDGILLARVSHGVLEHNVAWDTGMQETETIGTPNAIWEWRCSDCRVEYNEGYFSDSPGVDGGVFDVDYGNENNRVENNFGHDSQGYCVSVFGAEGPSGNSTASTIRHNTCIHNGRSPRLAKRQGAIYLSTWHGGKLNGVILEGNTVVWEPPLDAPAFKSTAEFTGDLANRFDGNTILAASGSFVSSGSNMQFADNLYCTPTEADEVAPETHALCGCMQELLARTSGTDQHLTADRRPAGTACPNGDAGPIPARGSLSAQGNRWTLFAVMAPEGAQAATSRSQLILMESMMRQFASRGLASVVAPAYAMSKDQLDEWQSDWSFDPKVHVDASSAEVLRKAYNVFDATELLLTSPSGEIAARWTYPVSPADVWLQLQRHLGTPAGVQSMPDCSGRLKP
ncbi:MAG: right-handed parallel beta-helix repeat-containing protein [Terracidiphilus sp.]